jgi:hypothetical protein
MARDEDEMIKYEINFKMFIKLVATISGCFGRKPRRYVHPNVHVWKYHTNIVVYGVNMCIAPTLLLLIESNQSLSNKFNFCIHAIHIQVSVIPINILKLYADKYELAIICIVTLNKYKWNQQFEWI